MTDNFKFKARFWMALTQAIATGLVWYEYFQGRQLGLYYPAEVLAASHYQSPPLLPAAISTAVTVYLWGRLIYEAFKRDQADHVEEK